MAGDPHALREAMARLNAQPEPLPHRHFVEVGDQLDEAIESYGVVFLLGPTGVGKTARIKATIAASNACVADDPDRLCAAMVTARTPRARLFSFKQLSIDALRALEEPLPERKLGRTEFGSGARSRRAMLPGKRSEAELFDAVRAAARDRGLRVLFIDEAVPLVRHRSDHVLVQTLDVLRDLADGIGFSIVLVATPRILDGLTMSCELSRRRAIVYLHRYRETDPVEFRAYGRAVRSLLGKLPPDSRPKLTAPQHRLLLRGTTGCVGEMFRWLHRATERCLRAGEGALRWEHFEATVLADDDLCTQLEQCRHGETLHAELTQRTFGADLQWEHEHLSARAQPDREPETRTPPPFARKAQSGRRIAVPGAKRRRIA